MKGRNKRGKTYEKWLKGKKKVPWGFKSWPDAREYWKDGATIGAAVKCFPGLTRKHRRVKHP